MKTLSLTACLALVLLAFAGCADDPASGTVLSSAPAPTVSANTGSITGVVTDDEALPLGLADVAVRGPAESAVQTDAEGRFTINDLPPGTYTLFAQRLGFESTSRKADVVAGEPTNLTIILVGIAVEHPRVETSTYVGFMDGDVYTAGVGLYYPRSFPINLTRGATEVVTTAKWDSTVAVFARYLRVQLSYDDASLRRDGKSPVTANISGFSPVDKEKERATVSWGVTFGCPAPAGNPTGFVNCVPGNPDALVPQIAYQQRVNFYNAVFYYQHAPPGYTGLG